MKRAQDGCPKCEKCGRRVEDPKHIIVNKETNEDYCLCEACNFFQGIKPTPTKRRVISMSRLSAIDLLGADFTQKSVDELRKLRHNLYARKCNAKDEATKAKYEAKIAELKAALKGKKNANVESKPETAM